MIGENSVIYRFLCTSWVLITRIPRKYDYWHYEQCYVAGRYFCFCIFMGYLGLK